VVNPQRKNFAADLSGIVKNKKRKLRVIIEIVNLSILPEIRKLWKYFQLDTK